MSLKQNLELGGCEISKSFLFQLQKKKKDICLHDSND